MAPAIAYKYFLTSNNDNLQICKLCNKSIKCRMRGSSHDPTNLMVHLRLKHPGVLNLPSSNNEIFKNETVEKPSVPYNNIFESPPISLPQNVPKLNSKPPEYLYPNSSSSNICTSPNNSLSSNPNEINFNVEDLKLIHPFSLIVSGPTSSGKSTLIFQILDNLHQNTTPVIEKVVYIYGIYQDIFKKYPNIFFTDNLEFMDCSTEVPTVIILDDLMSVLNNSKKLEELFTRGVHHRKVSVVLTLQNLFYHGGVMKTLRDNAMYIALTKHIQDVSKLDTFARQLESKNSNYFKDSYADAVSKKYGYLFCDLHPHSELRDGHFKIKYRSLVHKPIGQVLYLPKGQGMSKAVIHSDALENPEQVKALVKSGPTLPDTFKFSSPGTSVNPTSCSLMQAASIHHPKLSIPHSTPTPVNLTPSSNLTKSDDDTSMKFSEFLNFFATYLAKPGSNPNTHANNYVVKPTLASPDIDTMKPTSLKNTKRVKEESAKPQKFAKAYLEAAALAFPPYPSFNVGTK